MSFRANVYLWGSKIGIVTQESVSTPPIFTYDEEFLESGIELSPIMMPLSEKNILFPV